MKLFQIKYSNKMYATASINYVLIYKCQVVFINKHRKILINSTSTIHRYLLDISVIACT